MGTLIRNITKRSYKQLVKPVLFKASPDTVHSRTVKIGASIGANRVALRLMESCWGFEHVSLRQTIHGVTYSNPVGLAAGFDKNIQLGSMLERIGFGFYTGGSVTGKYCEGNPRPWFYRLPEHKALVVHAGLANIGSVGVSKLLANQPSKTKPAIPLSISVARTNSKQASSVEDGIHDYVLAIKNLQRFPEMFEINISCPNTYGGEPYTTPRSLHALLTAIDALNITQPIYIKMPSDLAWPKFSKLLEVIAHHNVQGVTICNLLKDRTGLTVPEGIHGGISGMPVQSISDDLIYKTYQHFGQRLTIIGVGGIFTAEDAYRKIKNGASLIGLVTGLIYEGPQLVGEINSGLVRLLEADGYRNISEAIGTAVK